MTEIRCYVFGEIPGVHHSWTLAVMAIGEKDARDYVRATHRGGKLIQKLGPGSTVKASCGAATEKAQEVLREKNRKEQEQFDGAFERCKRDNPDANDARIYQLVGAYL